MGRLWLIEREEVPASSHYHATRNTRGLRVAFATDGATSDLSGNDVSAWSRSEFLHGARVPGHRHAEASRFLVDAQLRRSPSSSSTSFAKKKPAKQPVYVPQKNREFNEMSLFGNYGDWFHDVDIEGFGAMTVGIVNMMNKVHRKKAEGYKKSLGSMVFNSIMMAKQLALETSEQTAMAASAKPDKEMGKDYTESMTVQGMANPLSQAKLPATIMANAAKNMMARMTEAKAKLTMDIAGVAVAKAAKGNYWEKPLMEDKKWLKLRKRFPLSGQVLIPKDDPKLKPEDQKDPAQVVAFERFDDPRPPVLILHAGETWAKRAARIAAEAQTAAEHAQLWASQSAESARRSATLHETLSGRLNPKGSAMEPDLVKPGASLDHDHSIAKNGEWLKFLLANKEMRGEKEGAKPPVFFM